MFYLYILYSDRFDKFYIGSSEDPWARTDSHNGTDGNTFTSKYRPWKLAAVFRAGQYRGDAVKVERFVKKQKSRSLLEKLVDTNFVPTGNLAQLVRVPHVRD